MDKLKKGDHFWALYQGQLIVLIKTDHNLFFVCGGWEGSFIEDDFQFIEKIEKPQNYNHIKTYYAGI